MLKFKHKNSIEGLQEYKEPIYDKINSIYGYLVFFDLSAYFIYSNHGSVYKDDVTDDYIIEIIL